MDYPTDWINVFDASDSSMSIQETIGSSSNYIEENAAATLSSADSVTSSLASVKTNESSQACSSSVPEEADCDGDGGPTISSIQQTDELQDNVILSPPAEDVILMESPYRNCTGCKSSSPAVANCFSCVDLLCANCVIAHQLMVAFEGHHVTNLGPSKPEVKENGLNMVGSIESVRKMVKDGKKKLNELQKTIKSVDYSSSRLTSQYDKAVGEVDETFNFYMSMLAERKLEVVKEIEKLYSSKQVALSVFGQKVHESTDKIGQMVSFIEKLLQSASVKDVLLFQSSLENRMSQLVSNVPQLDLAHTVQLEFISNFQAIQVGVRNQFGYIKSGSGSENGTSRQAPISRPTPPTSIPGVVVPQVNNSVMSGLKASPMITSSLMSGSKVKEDAYDFQNNFLLSHCDESRNRPAHEVLNGLPYLSSGSNVGLPTSDLFSPTNSVPIGYSSKPASLATPVPPTPIVYPPKAQIRRQKMIYHCKFGEFGILEGQFTEPSGVAVTDDNEIIVADTNNHRIQVFDKEGNFKFQFGEVGKRDGQLLYPNRVAVIAATGDIVVTERSPTHQVQIFTKYGHFVRKFGADVLQHPRGVTTDFLGRIIVVECKVMRVVIFDMLGNVLNKFSCSRYLEFPNGVIVNDRMEIFISDNRAHCVKVFDYQGNYLRQIGGEGVSNFPIGVGLTASGEIAIADNHNNFNLTVFSQTGQLLGALESKVKHAQCFDVALMKDGSIVLASKDYRLYIYRYVKVPNLSL